MSKTPEIALGYKYKISRVRAISEEANRLRKLYKKKVQLGISECFAGCIERQISDDCHRIESLAGDMTSYEKNSTK